MEEQAFWTVIASIILAAGAVKAYHTACFIKDPGRRWIAAVLGLAISVIAYILPLAVVGASMFQQVSEVVVQFSTAGWAFRAGLWLVNWSWALGLLTMLYIVLSTIWRKRSGPVPIP